MGYPKRQHHESRDDQESDGWTTIESDPGVFTSLIHSFGVKGLQVEELYSLDEQSFHELGNSIYGLVFLFKWIPRGKKENVSNTAPTVVPIAPTPTALPGDVQAMDVDTTDKIISSNSNSDQPNVSNVPRLVPYHELPDMFFANQVINNACATQALLSILLNIPKYNPKQPSLHTHSLSIPDPLALPFVPCDPLSFIDLGDELTNLKEFTRDFDPQFKGLTISNSETIRRAHNSFSPHQHTMIDKELNPALEKDDEAFHFISYVVHHGCVYELDGLNSGPVLLGSIDKSTNPGNVNVSADTTVTGSLAGTGTTTGTATGTATGAMIGNAEAWWNLAVPAIQQRIREYSGNEIRFNLMAVVADREMVLGKERAMLESKLQILERGEDLEELKGLSGVVDPASVGSGAVTGVVSGAGMDDDEYDPQQQKQIVIDAVSGNVDGSLGTKKNQKWIDKIKRRLSEIDRLFHAESSKRAQWKLENDRRKFNYVPFMMEMIKLLASKGELSKMLQEAKELKAGGGVDGSGNPRREHNEDDDDELAGALGVENNHGAEEEEDLRGVAKYPRAAYANGDDVADLFDASTPSPRPV